MRPTMYVLPPVGEERRAGFKQQRRRRCRYGPGSPRALLGSSLPQHSRPVTRRAIGPASMSLWRDRPPVSPRDESGEI